MTQNTLSPDDPRLTAYALNEMPATERAEFEQLLAQDAAARQAVEEIRAAGALFATALENEPAATATAPVRPAAIIPGGDLRKLDGGPRPGARILRFPQFYYMASGLAAACFALFFAYWQHNQPPPRSVVEIDLQKLKPADPQGGGSGSAFTAPAPAPANAPAVTMALAPKDEEVLVLQPFETKAGADAGYAATVTVNGSGPIRTDLRDQSATAVAAEGNYTAASTIAGTRVTAGSGAQGSAVDDAARETRAALSAAESSAFLAKAQAARARHERQVEQGRNIGSITLRAPVPAPDFTTEAYAHRRDNEFARVADHPLSTFSIDVDTAAYANVRRFLAEGRRPPVDAVRIEELVNYFPYHYAALTGNVPFAASLEVASAPWRPEHRLVRIGLKGREVSEAARPPSNLVFLVDVSGSMHSANKLPLVKQSLRLLVDRLRPDDRVAIAVYAGSSGLALPSTPVSRKGDIVAAIDRLEAGGSTNGAMGIHLAYDVAKANFIDGGANRVILATDGDFNVGTTSEGELVRLVGEKARDGVFLTVLGFGTGNLKDSMLEQIADQGNGHYAYIDSAAEGRKVLVEQAGGTLLTIAKDVKIQVEFNPALVAGYRLIGYENRLLAKEDFNNDQVDAGEIGAGHTVTALYEVVPAGVEWPGEAPAVDGLKYQRVAAAGATATPPSKHRGEVAAAPNNTSELLTVKIRYKEPAGETSSRLEFPLRDTGARFEDASQDFKFAAAVAAFGMALRDSPHKGTMTLADVSRWARAGVGSDAGGYRSEFIGLVEQARTLVQ
jgi:Ca-activated chloride channel family protein